MLTYLTLLFALKSNRRAATLLEYAVIASVIGAIVVLGTVTLGPDLADETLWVF
jgi:Flp pilus assembly pilin Flp